MARVNIEIPARAIEAIVILTGEEGPFTDAQKLTLVKNYITRMLNSQVNSHYVKAHLETERTTKLASEQGETQVTDV